MTKKNKNSAADDLLDSLLEDVKIDSDLPSEIENPEGMFSFKSEENQKFEGRSTDEYENNKNEENFGDLILPEVKDEKLDVPELGGHYQSPMDVFASERTMAIDAPANLPPVPASDSERTVAVTAFAHNKKNKPVAEKVPIGSVVQKAGQVYTSMDASLIQADSLKLAQQRILQLEKELESYRAENDDLASAAEIIKLRSNELENKLSELENEKNEIHDQAHSEKMLLKGNLQFKETELAKLRFKVDELDSRLKSDFKKIRSKERELENRLELARAEKHALVRAKDDNILELQRKIDQMKSELDNYRSKVSELNKTLDEQNDQIRRTVRALRLGLTNLEVKGDFVVPLKKAE